jgi:ribosomal protein L7/L12
MTALTVGLGSVGVTVILCSLFMGRRGVASVPPRGKATMQDVKRLVQAGQRIDAIRCYREIHQVGLAEAKDAVENIAITD